MIAGDPWALVPLRELGRGKERLAPVLDAPARSALIEAMASDVIVALRAAGFPPARILLVSGDAGVAELAQRLGVGLCARPRAPVDPLNTALVEASAQAAAAGAPGVLMLHADLPLIDAAAIRELCSRHALRSPGPRATLVSDRAGTGTNCLILTPPGSMTLRFGADSRARHRQAAITAGVQYGEFTDPRLAFDVDFAADLRALVRLAETPDNACGQATRAWLGAHRALFS